MELEITFLGIGAADAYHSFSSTSLLLRFGQETILVDCGPDTPRRLLAQGLAFSDITTMWITHRHLDHCGGVAALMFGRGIQSFEDEEAKRPIRVIAEPETWDAITRQFAFGDPEFNPTPFPVELSEVDGFDSTIDGLRFRSCSVQHSVPCYGLTVAAGDKTLLAYSSDTVPFQPFVEAAAGAQVLVHEATFPDEYQEIAQRSKHSTVSGAAEAISEIGPGRARLVHLPPRFAEMRGELGKIASEKSGVSAVYPEEGSSVKASY
jgi:ribonuclease BN (tRNA processing enzyme)